MSKHESSEFEKWMHENDIERRNESLVEKASHLQVQPPSRMKSLKQGANLVEFAKESWYTRGLEGAGNGALIGATGVLVVAGIVSAPVTLPAVLAATAVGAIVGALPKGKKEF